MAELITDDLIARLKKSAAPEKYQRIIFDTKLPGFAVRVTPGNGIISFILNYTRNRKQHRCTLGRVTADFKTKDARAAADDKRKEIRSGSDPLAHRKAPTVAALAAEYFDSDGAQEKRSIGQERGMLRRHILPRFGDVKISAITSQDADDLHQSLRKGKPTANRVRILLSTLCNFAIKKKYIQSNPVLGTERFKEKPREKWLSFEQVQYLQAALDICPDELAADMIRLLLYTGARSSEAFTAQWSDFDFRNAMWTKDARFHEVEKDGAYEAQ